MAKRGKAKRGAAAPDEAAGADARRRWLNTLLKYWTVCDSNACKRARGCTGDADECFRRFWPVTPEGIRFEIRGYILAMKDGLSPEDAIRKVEADKIRMADQIAAVEARQYGEAEPQHPRSTG